jgi:hypothetical protein
METNQEILTIKEVAQILRCSKAHVANALHGKVTGISAPHARKCGPPKTHTEGVAQSMAGSEQEPLISRDGRIQRYRRSKETLCAAGDS